jgi:hypothetical protein
MRRTKEGATGSETKSGSRSAMQILVDIPEALAGAAHREPEPGNAIQDRRAERELFFWTTREALELGMSATRLLLGLIVVGCLVVSLLKG